MLALGIASLLLTQSQAKPIPDIDWNNLPYQQQVKQMADGWREKYHLPGVWCAYIREGRVVACVATGVRSIKTNEPALASDRLGVGSVTKVITGSLIAVFVAKGKIAYETTVGDVFPDLRREFPESSLNSATLRQLLNHTSGLPKGFVRPPATSGPEFRLKILKKAIALKGRPKPGTRFEYSNLAFDVAVAMVEHITGQTYEDWLFGAIGREIGLKSPVLSDGHVNKETPVSPHFLSPEGVMTGFEEPPPVNDFGGRGLFDPAGGVYVNLPDLCGFALFTIKNSAVLPERVYQELVFPVSDYPIDGVDGGQILPRAPRVTGAGWERGLSGDLIKGGVTGRGEAARVRMNVKSGSAFIVYVNAFPKSGPPSLTEMVDGDIGRLMRKQ